MTFPHCGLGAHFKGFRKFFGMSNSMTFAMTISFDLVIWPQSDAPVVRRQFTEAIRSIAGSLAVN